MTSPLADYTVLDLTRARSGPTCVRQLADMGANVIQIESIEDPDQDFPRHGSDFQNHHRNKRPITLNLKDERRVAILNQLVAKADVLVENFAPGVVARLGLGYDELVGANERLIFASISGFGQSGPQSSRRAYGATAHAEAGLLWVQQQAHDDGEILAPGITIADIVTGMNAFSAILAALYDREHTGRGQHIDVTLMERALDR